MYDGIIEEKTEELHLALNREQNQLDKYRTRVRAMEETGGYNILTVLMSSGDFNEFLTALDDMEKIMTADRDLEDAYIEAREESERVKAEYEEVKADCEAKQEVLNTEKEMLDGQITSARKKKKRRPVPRQLPARMPRTPRTVAAKAEKAAKAVAAA